MDTKNWYRRSVLGGFCLLTALLVSASVAWACTLNPFRGTGQPVLEATYDQVHCEVIHGGDPNCPEDGAAVTFVAHGNGPMYPGKTFDVFQDNDDTNAAPGQFMSGIGGCDTADDVRGTITYGQQTVDNWRIGTGSGVLVATDGPGLYGICAGAAGAEVNAIGQFIFM